MDIYEVWDTKSLEIALSGRSWRQVRLMADIEAYDVEFRDTDGIIVTGAYHPNGHATITGKLGFVDCENVRLGQVAVTQKDWGSRDDGNRDALRVTRCQHVRVAACEFYFASDENVSIWDRSYDVVIERCIVAWGLQPHSMGILIGKDSDQVTIRNNIIAHCVDRSPALLNQVAHANIINNLTYNVGNGLKLGGDGGRVNIVGNVRLTGPDNEEQNSNHRCHTYAQRKDWTAFIDDNICPDRPLALAPQQYGLKLGHDVTVDLSPTLLPTIHPITPIPSGGVPILVPLQAGCGHELGQRVKSEIWQRSGRIVKAAAEIM